MRVSAVSMETAAVILMVVYAMYMGAMIGFIAGMRGYRDRVTRIQEVCPNCDGYGHRIDITVDHKVKRDSCELCRGTGALDHTLNSDG